MTDGSVIDDGKGVHCYVVASGTLTVAFLGTKCKSEDQELSER
jgi:hypothetical protein